MSHLRRSAGLGGGASFDLRERHFYATIESIINYLQSWEVSDVTTTREYSGIFGELP
jgi:hypothetical protein